jgi:hypothetical protein
MLLLLFTLPAAAGSPDAMLYCDEEIFEWQRICYDLDILPAEDCIIADICLALEAEAPQDDILKGARIETPADAPEGFEERIYIIP